MKLGFLFFSSLLQENDWKVENMELNIGITTDVRKPGETGFISIKSSVSDHIVIHIEFSFNTGC